MLQELARSGSLEIVDIAFRTIDSTDEGPRERLVERDEVKWTAA